MGEDRAGVAEEASIGIVEPDAVAEDRPGCEQAGATVDLCVRAAGVEVPDQFALAERFGEVGLDEAAGGGGEAASTFEESL
jgi:hypothetical protein